MHRYYCGTRSLSFIPGNKFRLLLRRMLVSKTNVDGLQYWLRVPAAISILHAGSLLRNQRLVARSYEHQHCQAAGHQ